MKNHSDEKYALENAALGIFLNLFNLNHKDQLKLVEKRESPDFVLENLKGELLGLEVAHLFYDSEEAKMILGRSNNDLHGIEIYENFISALNHLLKQKEKKILKYENTYPTALLIRNASPIFGMSCLLRNKNLIYKPRVYNNVWFVSKDGNYNDWLMTDILKV
ncbi:hypothetical protein A3844_07315 [Paenibacillus helianthi]|uniref:Uncharacterized protein n=1 Tax=Paenibacillus helianthi TaxID=1349432 RepID=A0ABX3ETF2_9BACL|nr:MULTISPECIES: hypothetical protein [Paenibacillus]OKP88503.1 hypothetical protein A3844_07315 [Paenibacillus helianthi]OKP92974.1 hypothetical protein A3848_06245 [Paenibacillus sp. P32E]